MAEHPLFKPGAENAIGFGALDLFRAGFRSSLWFRGVLLIFGHHQHVVGFGGIFGPSLGMFVLRSSWVETWKEKLYGAG